MKFRLFFFFNLILFHLPKSKHCCRFFLMNGLDATRAFGLDSAEWVDAEWGVRTAVVPCNCRNMLDDK